MVMNRFHTFCLPILALGLLVPSSGHAQVPQPDPERIQQEAAQRAAAKEQEKAKSAADLKAIEDRLAASASARAKLESEMGTLRADRAKLNASLLEATARTQGLETRIAALENRLSLLADNESAIRRSLEGRRGLIGEVLAALQRMGRRPPPAVLVRPEDMLEAVRASILLGAVLPELKLEIETLAADLGELVRLRESMASDRKALAAEFEQLAGERQRLAALVEVRRRRESQVSAEVEAGREQATGLASQARTLREFVESIEKDIAVANRAIEEARKSIEAETKGQRDRMAQLAFKDPARLAPKAAFAQLRGLLPLPAAGSQIRAYGAADAAGGPARGLSLETRPKALVSAPTDAWVVYAGPFRSFGHLLILNAGNGYYILLAGMQRIDVTLNQFVLAGEPVAVMGETADSAAVMIGSGDGNPVLYVEFRKDGTPVDPGPWWAKSQGEKVRG